MENKVSLGKINAYLKENWFKLSLFLIVGFVILQKDFSFNFDLHTPFRPKMEQEIPTEDTSKQQVVKKERSLTNNYQKEEQRKEKTSFIDRFELPFFGSSKKVVNALEALEKVDIHTKKVYLKRFLHVAKEEQKKFGIPASITLANAFLHSHAGRRNITKGSNNHFAISCNYSWEGNTDNYNGKCYRKYETAWSSFRDHSLYLTRSQFSNLRRLDPLDYKAWAKELERAKFSKEAFLSRNLIHIIEKYGLDRI